MPTRAHRTIGTGITQRIYDRHESSCLVIGEENTDGDWYPDKLTVAPNRDSLDDTPLPDA